MLILITGVTGTFGQYLAQSALEKGHQVRGFGPSPSKLPKGLSAKLESFIQCEYYAEMISLDRAVSGVDAVICSYYPQADGVLDAQTPLLRGTERAGVKIYHGHSRNAD